VGLEEFANIFISCPNCGDYERNNFVGRVGAHNDGLGRTEHLLG
jgi:hypothetical protein